jgi:hypothetical protein
MFIALLMMHSLEDLLLFLEHWKNDNGDKIMTIVVAMDIER